MRAKDLFFDFLETVLLIALTTFVIFYFIIGDRLYIAQRFINLILPLSVVAIPFILKIKLSRRQIRKFQNESAMDEVAVYPRLRYIDWDIRFAVLVPLMLVLIPFILSSLTTEDIVQAFLSGILMAVWHFHIFKDSAGRGLPQLTRLDIIKDQIAIYLMPVLILIVPMLGANVDYIDAIQVIFFFVFMYIWRQLMFYHA
jgi:hypothetical protein